MCEQSLFRLCKNSIIASSKAYYVSYSININVNNDIEQDVEFQLDLEEKETI